MLRAHIKVLLTRCNIKERTFLFSIRLLDDVDDSFEMAMLVDSEEHSANTEEVILSLLRSTGIYSNVETKPKEQRRR